MKLTDEARSKVENAETKPSYFYRMGPLGQEFGINGKIVSPKEYCDALKPWCLPALCVRSVFEKTTGRFIGCVQGVVDKEEGKYFLKGELGFILVDLTLHTTKLATQEELKLIGEDDFYESVKDAPNIAIVRFHDRERASELHEKWKKSQQSEN